MVSVRAFLRAKTTDEADNPRSNLNKDNFALHGSFVHYQHGLSFFAITMPVVFVPLPSYLKKLFESDIQCDCALQAFVQRKYSIFIGGFTFILGKSICFSFQTEMFLSNTVSYNLMFLYN